MTAPRHAIVDQQLVDDTLGRVMTIGDDFADIRPAAARPHPLAGAAAARIVADRARARLAPDMVRPRSGARVASSSRRARPLAADRAARFGHRGHGLARSGSVLALVVAHPPLHPNLRPYIATAFLS